MDSRFRGNDNKGASATTPTRACWRPRCSRMWWGRPRSWQKP